MNDEYKELVSKRFQTTMIGALYEFEKVFGYLWGQEKNPDFLTENEESFRFKWENVRNQILNNGNSQMRKCLSDLEKSNNRYYYKFYNKKGSRKYED